jgi:hypothetical protein
MTRDEALFWLLVIGVPCALYLAGWGLSKVPRLVRGWRYDWAEAKHLTGPPVVEPEPDRDFYGAASLADELAWLAAQPEVAHERLPTADERTQMLAELAPETLDVSTEVAAALVAALDDSGPGEAPSVDPGPDPIVLHMLPEAEAEQWLRDHADDYQPRLIPAHVEPRDWVAELAPSRLADTGDIMDANLAADVAAYQRAQNDQVRAWCSGWERERREFTRHLAEAWA